MARLQYNGTSGTREFSAADMKLLGVEGDSAKKIVFVRKEPTEVPDDVHEVFLTDARVKGEFSDAGEVEPLDDNSKKAAAEQKARDAAGDNELGDEAVKLTAAQQAKADKAAKTAASKKDALPAEADETGAHPQTTDTTVADAGDTGAGRGQGSSASGATSN